MLRLMGYMVVNSKGFRYTITMSDCIVMIFAVVQKGEPMDDLISRQAAIDELDKGAWGVEWDKTLAKTMIESLPSAETEIIHCCDCIYYDPEHIEKNGVRYEYEDMPKDAFDILGTGLVNSEYGINVGGRCCRDYNVGYSEDKRVFVSKQNYCGRAERRTDG